MGNAELVRRGYEAWGKGDIDAVLSVVDPEVEWRGYTHIPEAGHLRGRDEVEAWLRRFREAWDELEVQVVDLTEANDMVVALVRMTGRGRGSGAEVRSGTDVHVWTFRDGKVVSVAMRQGTADVLRELGFGR